MSSDDGNKDAKWCLTIADNGHHAGSVLGLSWMIDKAVMFMLKGDSKFIGVADAECPVRDCNKNHGNQRPAYPRGLALDSGVQAK